MKSILSETFVIKGMIYITRKRPLIFNGMIFTVSIVAAQFHAAFISRIDRNDLATLGCEHCSFASAA